MTEFPGCVQSAFSATLGGVRLCDSLLGAHRPGGGLGAAACPGGGGGPPVSWGGGGPPCAGAPASGFWRSPPAPPPSGRLPPPRRPCPWRHSCWGGAGFRSTASPSPSGGRRGVRPGPYLRAKCLQGLLAAGITALAAAVLPLPVPAMAALPAPAAPGPVPWAAVALLALAGGCWWSLRQKRAGKAGERRV